MNKYMYDSIQKSYEDIFRGLNINWKTKFNVKYEILVHNGVSNSGMATREMYEFIKECVTETITKLTDLFNNLPEKYNRSISSKELHQYLEKTKSTLDGHIEIMKKDVEELFKNDKLANCESNNILLQNMKDNARMDIQKRFKEIENLRRGKNLENIVAINTIIAMGSFIIGLMSLIFQIIE